MTYENVGKDISRDKISFAEYLDQVAFKIDPKGTANAQLPITGITNQYKRVIPGIADATIKDNIGNFFKNRLFDPITDG